MLDSCSMGRCGPAREMEPGGPLHLESRDSLGSARGHQAVLVLAEGRSPALGDSTSEHANQPYWLNT